MLSRVEVVSSFLLPPSTIRGYFSLSVSPALALAGERRRGMAIVVMRAGLHHTHARCRSRR